MRTRTCATALTGALLCAVACGSPARDGNAYTASDRPALRPVALPPVAGMSESVAEQMQHRYAAVERERTRAPGHDAEYAEAYGELGEVLLGASYLDAVEPALSTQRHSILPTRGGLLRWHLYRSKGAVRESARQFDRARQRRPTDVPTLVWLVDALLSEGRTDEAEPLVRRVPNEDATSVAARIRQGGWRWLAEITPRRRLCDSSRLRSIAIQPPRQSTIRSGWRTPAWVIRRVPNGIWQQPIA